MDHTQATESFSDYWDKALPEARRKELEEHLATCASCRAEYEAFERTMAPLGKLGKVPAPNLSGMVPNLIHRRSRGRFFGPRGGGVPVEWVLLIMLAAVVAVYLLVRFSQPALRLP